MFWLLSALAQQMPVVEVPVNPTYPPSELESGGAAVVTVRMSLDESGRVVRASVEEGVSPAFDRAALDAARSTRFTPALSAKGDPVQSEILYEIRFDATVVPVVSIEGTAKFAGTREPADGVRMAATQADDVRFVTIQPDGTFAFVGLPDGPWDLRIDSPGYAPFSQLVTVKSGSVVVVDLTPKLVRPWEAENDDEVAEEFLILEEERAAEVSERVLSTEDIRYLPGTGGDIVKAIQNLPGIARPPFNTGQLLIRGTAPEDSAYYLDGVRVPAVFHFAGLSTVLNGDSLEEVALLSGNYSTRYGRHQGGLVDLRVNDELPKRSSGYLSVDVLQTTAFVEQKIGKNTALTVSGRRSYIDAVLSPVLSAAGGSTVRAPRYYDMQARLLHHTDQGVIDAMFLLSDDRFEVLGDTEDPDSFGIGLYDTFQKFRLRWTHDLGNAWEGEMGFIVGPKKREFEIGVFGNAREGGLEFNQRLEFRRGYQGGWHSWRMGLDLFAGASNFDYNFEDFGVRERGSFFFTSPSPYLEPSFRFGPVELTTGVRVDPWILDEGYMNASVDPRFVGRVEAGANTKFEAAVGQFSQFPGVRQVIESEAGNPDLGPARSYQASIGMEQKVFGIIDLEMTAFGSLLTDQVVGREDAFRFFTGPPPAGPLDTDPYANEGTGRVGGIEMLAKLQSDRTVGWLSATVSRSLRQKREDDKETLFIYDQPVILNALFSHQLPKGWRVGARARFGSGSPFNPVVNRIYDFDLRQFNPVYSPESERLPNFFALDVRIDKEFTFNRWSFSAYIDVQNATNQQNVDVMGWTDDYELEEPINGLPIVPAFGLRGDW